MGEGGREQGGGWTILPPPPPIAQSAETFQPKTVYILSLIHSPLIMAILLALICYAIFKLKKNTQNKLPDNPTSKNNTNIFNIESGLPNSSSSAETQKMGPSKNESSYNKWVLEWKNEVNKKIRNQLNASKLSSNRLVRDQRMKEWSLLTNI